MSLPTHCSSLLKNTAFDEYQHSQVQSSVGSQIVNVLERTLMTNKNPKHTDLFIAYSAWDYKNFSLLQDEDSLNQHQKVGNVVSARLSCLKAYTALQERFALLPC